jgi:hypothetical protein
MALVAQRIHIRHIQQSRILRAMRSVAAQTSLGLDHGMLVHKRTTRLCVTLGADGILIYGGLKVVVSEGAMRIVAVGTFHQALVNPVVKGHVELGLNIGMALEAQGGLADFQHRSLWSSLMHRVTADAAHVGLRMRRAKEVRMSVRMAAEAGGIQSLRIGCGQIEDLRLVSSGLYVSLPWSVAALAGHAFAAMFQRKLGMRI